MLASAALLLIAALTTTEMTGKTHLTRWIMSVHELSTGTKTSEIAIDSQSNTPSTKQYGAEPAAIQDTLFARRIADLQYKLEELETKLSSHNGSNPSPDAIAEVRSRLAELLAELPEYRRDRQADKLQQVGAAIEQLKQSTSPVDTSRGIDLTLQELNSRIEQLNQDLYRDFP